MASSGRQRLFQEILMARERVYVVGKPTPLEQLHLPVAAEVYAKREDLSPIHSYKWRGAFNRMAQLSDADRERGIIASSAGNHAQGVALAARRLGVHARIYMPTSTPKMKQAAVKRHGEDFVDVIMVGDTFDQAAAEAKRDLAESGRIFIHPYDDYAVMGGQGTLADEVVMSGHGHFDAAYIQIGGGGLAAGVACWLRQYYPDIHIVGVEGVEQASMRSAVEAGKPVDLDYVDVFCDGTAVKRAGDLTYPLCAELLDDFETVTNEEVSAAIEWFWKESRAIPEPSGAMGLAGLLKQKEALKGSKILVINCGANMDFEKLAWVAGHAAIGASRRRYMRFEIGERPGAFLELIETILEGVNIIDFQYGKVHPDKAWPVVGFEASPADLDLLDRRLADFGVPYEDVTSEEDVEFRIIHYETRLFSNPYFFRLEFPERAGALYEFLLAIRDTGANMCYFNYAYTGETVGRALLGFELASGDQRDKFVHILSELPYPSTELSNEVLERIL